MSAQLAGKTDADRPASPAHARWSAEVLRAFDGLDEPDRAALRLIYWRGLSQGQVASVLAIDEPAVRVCVARGLRNLAQRLRRGQT